MNKNLNNKVTFYLADGDFLLMILEVRVNFYYITNKNLKNFDVGYFFWKENYY